MAMPLPETFDPLVDFDGLWTTDLADYSHRVTESVDLSPVRFAALVAPAVDRAFIAATRAGGQRGRDLVAAHGGPAIGYLIHLRIPLAAGRPVTRDGLAAVLRYRAADELDQSVARSVAHGLLAAAPEGTLTATEAGHTFLRELSALLAESLAERWASHPERVDRLNETLATLLAEAAATAGAAWAVQVPPDEADDIPPGVRLLNQLSTLRYHRADAHAAAWQAAGLTAPQIVAMAPGPERDAIERDTDERAAAPYAVLAAGQRLGLLGDLAALP